MDYMGNDSCGINCLFAPRQALRAESEFTERPVNMSDYWAITINIRSKKGIRIGKTNYTWFSYNEAQQRTYLNDRYTAFLKRFSLQEKYLEFEKCPNSGNIHLHAMFIDNNNTFNIDHADYWFRDLESKNIKDYQPVYFERTQYGFENWKHYITKMSRQPEPH